MSRVLLVISCNGQRDEGIGTVRGSTKVGKPSLNLDMDRGPDEDKDQTFPPFNRSVVKRYLVYYKNWKQFH